MADRTMQPIDGARSAPATMLQRVLIADDDEDIREALRVVLEDEGYDILAASDGAQTLDLLQRSAPLVVLLDVFMPNMSGFEVLMQALQDDGLRARHAYIVLTAERIPYARIGPRFSQLVELYQIPIVPKPFDLDDLLSAVAQQARRLMPAPRSPHGAGETGSA